MKQKYVPLDKLSKRKKQEYYAAYRKDWGELNPVTRKTPNPKAYKRKKSGQRYEHEPLSEFYLLIQSLENNLFFSFGFGFSRLSFRRFRCSVNKLRKVCPPVESQYVHHKYIELVHDIRRQ